MNEMVVMHAAEIIKGGICSYLNELIAFQCNDKSIGRVILVVPESQKGDLQVPAGGQVVGFPDGPNRIANAIHLGRTVRRIMRIERPTIVHLHSTFAGAVLRLLLCMRRHRPGIVYCPHGWAFARQVHRFNRFAAMLTERLLSRMCDAIVCVAEFERQAAIEAGISPGKLAVVRNGIRATAESREAIPCVQWPSGCIRLLFVGRFDRQKGIDVLFRALDRLGSKVFAYIIGGSVRNVEFERVPDNAQSIGWRSPSEITSYYRSTDIVVIPSRWEGLPLVALEAMLAGCAVVATNVGGIPELIEDGVSGILVPVDDPDRLADAISSLSEADIRKMGVAAKARVLSLFDAEVVHRQILDIYKQVARDR